MKLKVKKLMEIKKVMRPTLEMKKLKADITRKGRVLFV